MPQVWRFSRPGYSWRASSHPGLERRETWGTHCAVDKSESLHGLDKNMNLRTPAIAGLISVLLIAIAGAQPYLCAQAPQASPPDFRQLLQQLALFSPHPCGSTDDQKNLDAEDVEWRLFTDAAEAVAQTLNANAAAPESPEIRANAALTSLEHASAKVNVAWPEENRFHFQILDLPPALVVKMSIRAQETFFVFGIPEEESGKPNHAWRKVGSEERSSEHDAPQSQLGLYRLHRGPSRNARFLARFTYSGCAGSIAVAYEALEWNPKGTGQLEPLVEQDGSLGLDAKVPDFEQIGKLQTEGPLITLPYCWFSAIDTWDNPSLCAVDTYDVTGDEVRFRSRTYNRPDLVPVAKVIEYAEKREYPAVLGYCTSEDIARALVREIPPGVAAEDLRVTRIGSGKERIELGDPPAYEFEVEKRPDRWVVVKFSTE